MGTEYEVRAFEKGDMQAFPDLQALELPDMMPGYAFTAVKDEKVIACGGVVTKHPGVGEAWLHMAPGSMRHALFLAKKVQQYLKEIIVSSGYHRVQMTIECDNKDLLVWSHFLGMTIEGCMRSYGADGLDHYMCARVNSGT